MSSRLALVLITEDNIDHYLPFLFSIFSDDKMMQHLKGIQASEPANVKERIITKIPRGGRSFIVKLRGPLTEDVGLCGINYVDSKNLNTDFGVLVHIKAWGTGIATECLYLMLVLSFEELKLHRFTLSTDVENAKMRSIAEKIGMNLESIRKDVYLNHGKYHSEAIYVLFEEEWPKVKLLFKEKFNLYLK